MDGSSQRPLVVTYAAKDTQPHVMHLRSNLAPSETKNNKTQNLRERLDLIVRLQEGQGAVLTEDRLRSGVGR